MILEQYRWIQGWHLNGFGTLFGGALLSWADQDTNMLCYNASAPGTHYVTAGYERTYFLRPTKAGDRLRFLYEIVHYGAKSVTVRCRCSMADDETLLVFTCLTTMVRREGEGLRQEVRDKVHKNSFAWNLVEQLRKDRAETPPHL